MKKKRMFIDIQYRASSTEAGHTFQKERDNILNSFCLFFLKRKRESEKIIERGVGR